MDRSEEPRTKKLVDRMEKLDDKAGKISQDGILAGYQQAVLDLRDRVEELEARIKLNCPACQERKDKVEQLRSPCEHEPICLPSSRGPVPIFAVAIEDARKMSVITPGAQPPIAFAIAMCRKCGLPYVAINTLEEAQPFEGGPAPIPLVRPGEPVGGTGDLG